VINATTEQIKTDALFVTVLELQMPIIVNNVFNYKRIEMVAPK
jgi:hypothetical protein